LNTCLRPNVSLGCIISAAFFFIAVLVPETVLADSLRLNIEDNYTVGSLKSTDQTGAVTKTNIEDIDQLYNLYMDKNIFPNLLFDAGGVFGRDNTVTKDATDLHSADNQFNIYTDLKLNARPFSSSIGYYKMTDTSTALGSTLTNVDERYSALFDWKPEADLPSLDINYIKDFNYDGRRILKDISTDDLLLDLRYNPLTTIGFTYDLNYVDSLDILKGSESIQTTNSGRITYGDSFFNKRVNVAATYNISSQSTETIAGKGGVSTVQIQLFPVHGLSGISDLTNPTQTPVMITLNENPALIDGGLTSSAGINLGLNSGLVTIPPPPRQEWNIGVDFVTPTQLTSLFIWVDKDLTKISDLFNWDIYTSDDNITWTKKFTVTGALSDFSTLPLPHFIIHFPSAITSRFVKAVVKPLDSIDQTAIIVRGLTPANFNDIAVTELQPFLFKAVSSTSQTKISESTLTQQLNLNGRAKLLENRDLFYDLSLFLARTDPGALTTAFVSNGLSFSQKFGGIFTLNARAAREDSYLVNGHGIEYEYSAALSATPYATLNDSLLYSGHYTTNPTGTTNIQNSIFLFNTAMLYPGVDALLSGGVTFGTLETGQSSNTLQANAGVTLVPNPKMNLNLTFSMTNSTLSGGNKPGISTTNYTGLASATYTPVSSLYLFASIQLNETNILQTTTNYGVNFSPFPNGDLQFHFVYNETLGPATNEISTLITPSLRWNIRPGAYLDLDYSIQQSTLAAQINDSKIFSSILTIVL